MRAQIVKMAANANNNIERNAGAALMINDGSSISKIGSPEKISLKIKTKKSRLLAGISVIPYLLIVTLKIGSSNKVARKPAAKTAQINAKTLWALLLPLLFVCGC